MVEPCFAPKRLINAVKHCAMRSLHYFHPENLTALGIDLNARAENLAIADYARLANWLADNPPENDENNLLN